MTIPFEGRAGSDVRFNIVANHQPVGKSGNRQLMAMLSASEASRGLNTYESWWQMGNIRRREAIIKH